MNLFLFPEAASLNNGYGIAVEYAYKRLKPKDDDIVVWYTDLPKSKMMHVKDNDIILKRNSFFSARSVLNVLSGKDRTELPLKGLDFLKEFDFDNIHCDEVIFYRALRRLYPNRFISLRFHNCFSRIYDRKRLLKISLDWKYETKLKNMYKLEREILNDKNVHKIFLSDEDRFYYTSNFGRTCDSETWPLIPNSILIYQNRLQDVSFNHKLVWFGGVESHKAASIKWLINEVLPKIKKHIPDIELHLYGRNTEKFDAPRNNVYGYGFYNGEGVPEKNALYVNPDIIGGGVKIKLIDLIEGAVPFITTPFGFEGYSRNLVDFKYCHVVETDDWANYIIKLIKVH